MKERILDILDDHEQLDELFLLHQERIFFLDLPGAQASLATYAESLRRHIRMEDEVILPPYRALAITARGAGADLFEVEHRKLERWLVGLQALLSGLEGEALSFRRALSILERQGTFKHLLEHHDRRERLYLYPILERELDATSKRELLANVNAFEERYPRRPATDRDPP